MKGDNKYKLNEKIKKEILIILKKYGRCSTSKLCFLATGHTNNYAVLKELESLAQENKITREDETGATYWRLHEKSLLSFMP
jgi:hypothetical protein